MPDALTRAAGERPAAQMQVSTVAQTDPKPYDIVEQRALTVLIMIVLLVAFVAMMVVPIQTAEELETGTFGALRLAATGPEILAAKAIAGCTYGVAGVAVTALLTRLDIDDPALFFGAALALVVSLVAFGLLLGLLAAQRQRHQHLRRVLPVPARRLSRSPSSSWTPACSSRSSTSCRSARRPGCSATAWRRRRRSTPA